MFNQKSTNPLFDPKAQQDNSILTDPAKVKMLNTPPADPAGLKPEEQEFLNMVMQKVESKQIDLLKPSSLLNQAVYEKLTPEAQAKADFNAMNLLAIIRQIHSVWSINKEPTYMIQNLILDVKYTKEKLEEVSGDVYII